MGRMSNFFRKRSPEQSAQETFNKHEAIRTQVNRRVAQIHRVRAQRQIKDVPLLSFNGYAMNNRLTRDVLQGQHIVALLRTIRTVNPAASQADWNYARLSNLGHQLNAYAPDGSEDQSAKDYCEELAKRVFSLYGGGTDVGAGVLNMSGLWYGAQSLEVEFEDNLRDVRDFHVVNPFDITFQQDEETGNYIIGQMDGPEFRPLNPEQVFYLPIDPEIGDPYGKIPMLPAIQEVAYAVQVYDDLRRVAHNQGYPRLDIKFLEQALYDNLPEGIIEQGEEEILKYVNSYMDSLEEQFVELEVDSDYIHPDSVEIDTVGGAGSGTINFEGIVKITERQLNLALKQLPVLMGQNEGTTETHGTVQMKVYVAGIQAIQRNTKRILEKAYNTALRAQGSQATVKITFDNILAEDRKSEAEAESIEIQNEIAKTNQGWQDNNTASINITGSEAVSDPKPPPAPIIQAPAGNEPEDNDEDDDEDGDSPTAKLKGKWRAAIKKPLPMVKAFKPDEEVKEVKAPWAEEVAKETTRFANITALNFQRQAEEYSKRVSILNELPEFDSEEEGKDWIRQHILYDSEEWQDVMLEDVEGVYLDVSQIAGQTAIDDLFDNVKNFLPDVMTFFAADEDEEETITFDLDDPAFLEQLEERFASYRLLQDTTDDTVMDIILQGAINRLSIDTIAKQIEDSTDFKEARAYTTARTETLNAARGANRHGWEQADVVDEHEWRTGGKNIRSAHRSANGQRKPMKEPFIISGHRLMYPGDSSMGAPADMIINCKCVEIPIVNSVRMWNFDKYSAKSCECGCVH
jgi:Phage Mu protein F like protein